MILKFLYQSVSWLTFSLKLDKCRDIYSSGWDIFLNSFGDIPGMFLHKFSICLNVLYVCQSVSWLTSLMKLDKYGDISCSWWDIFLIFLGGIPEMCLHHFPIIAKCLYVCQSVSWLTSLLKLDKCRFISCSWWDIFMNFFDIFLGCFYTFFKWLQFFCLPVC